MRRLDRDKRRAYKNAYQNLILTRNGLRISGLEFGIVRDSKRIQGAGSNDSIHSRIHLAASASITLFPTGGIRHSVSRWMKR
jgi:hypothetical protein